jgi:hypothetical protein
LKSTSRHAHARQRRPKRASRCSAGTPGSRCSETERGRAVAFRWGPSGARRPQNAKRYRRMRTFPHCCLAPPPAASAPHANRDARAGRGGGRDKTRPRALPPLPLRCTRSAHHYLLHWSPAPSLPALYLPAFLAAPMALSCLQQRLRSSNRLLVLAGLWSSPSCRALTFPCFLACVPDQLRLAGRLGRCPLFCL